MGVYRFLHRAPTRLIKIGDEVVEAHCFSYSYREPGTFSSAACNRRISVKEAAAERSWENRKSDYAITCDVDGSALNHSVYRNVRRGFWWDTDEFPGELVGFVGSRGGNSGPLPVVYATGWESCTSSGPGGIDDPATPHLPAKRRNIVMPGGKVGSEVRFAHPSGGWLDSYEEALAAHTAMAKHIGKSIDAAAGMVVAGTESGRFSSVENPVTEIPRNGS